MITNFIWRLYNGFISNITALCLSGTPQNSCKFSALVGFAVAFCCQHDTKQQEHTDESGLYMLFPRLDTHFTHHCLGFWKFHLQTRQLNDLMRRTEQADQQADWLAFFFFFNELDTDAF